MIRSRRQRIVLLALGLLIILVSGTFWLTRQAIRQTRFDHGLIAAVAEGDAAKVKVYLDRGADPNARETPVPLTLMSLLRRQFIIGDPALVVAAEQDRTDIAQLLLERGADIDVRGVYKQTALIRASRSGNERVVRLLLAKKANVDLIDEDGWTTLGWAVASDNKPIIAMLRQVGTKK